MSGGRAGGTLVSAGCVGALDGDELDPEPDEDDPPPPPAEPESVAGAAAGVVAAGGIATT